MSFPPHGYPLAAAVSPRLHVIDSVDSTNAKLLRDAAADPQGHPHLAVVLTRDQRAGRGRLDRAWTTPPGSALAVSVLLRVGAVPIADRGWIPLLAGAAMTRAIARQLTGLTVALKWPNDVLVGVSGPSAAGTVPAAGATGSVDAVGAGLPGARKICGILAEVLPGDATAVVVGAGVNTAMTSAELPVATATSFAAFGREADEDRLLADYLTGLRDGIADLAVRGGRALRAQIEPVCATLGAEVRVSLPGGTELTGRAQRLDDTGRLIVSRDGVEAVVAAGDVVHVR